ncbi:hypothetical protein MLD38_038881 [Melastoma candidum]|uniref:Uncharacterized protein n=1 Tax=Melastoma candidum TaxID=119954 RepID=A0ACB9L102_9MYRT|nr:hypothetical protein MLD38_038881 [Melastoma candidum]
MVHLHGNEEPHWISKVKFEGVVPLLDSDDCSNGWTSPPGNKFMVRGPEYFSTRVKVPAGDYLLKPIGFDWIKSSVKISEVMKNPNSRIRKVLDSEFPEGGKPFIWAFNLQVPSKDNLSVVAYFTMVEPIIEGSMMDRFLKGDDQYRNSKLKMIANIVKGPWIVKTAVGEQAICVIGRALTCQHCVSDNFLEVDVDIGSSMVAGAVVNVALGYVTTLTVDLAFLIESQTASELPERILGAFRFSGMDPASALEVKPSFSEDAMQSASPTTW